MEHFNKRKYTAPEATVGYTFAPDGDTARGWARESASTPMPSLVTDDSHGERDAGKLMNGKDLLGRCSP